MRGGVALTMLRGAVGLAGLAGLAALLALGALRTRRPARAPWPGGRAEWR
jgi:hypothetical protein